MPKTWLNIYQKFRAFLNGKRLYIAEKNGDKRYFYSSSLKQAQSKFINTKKSGKSKWKVYKWKRGE